MCCWNDQTALWNSIAINWSIFSILAQVLIHFLCLIKNNNEYNDFQYHIHNKNLFYILISRFLQALVGLFELPQDESIPEDERFIEIEETPGYQNSYSKLIFASKKDYDPLQTIQDHKTNLAQSLSKLSVGNPGTIRPLVNQTEPKVQEYLNVYLRNANVNLNWEIKVFFKLWH